MTKILLAIGNPGERYEGTRHNAGVLLLSHLKEKWGYEAFSPLGMGEVLVSEGMRENVHVVCAHGVTFMNNSGSVAKKLLSHFDASLEDLLVFHDDIDLPIGSFKLSCGSGSAGHNGVRSLIDTLGTKDFCRLRIGIAPKTLFGNVKKPPKEKVPDFVLKPFKKREMGALIEELDAVEEAVTTWLK